MSSEQDFYELLRGMSDIKPTAPSEGSAVEREISVGDPDISTPVTIRNLFVHHDTHPMVLDLALLKVFGIEWFTWDPATIWSEIKRIFKTEISEHARVKIQTVKSLHMSNLPWTSWNVFEKIIQGLNNNLPTWELMQVPSLEQLYAGIDIMNSIRHVEFSSEVKMYIASAVLHEEVMFVPPPLDFVQVEVSQPYYKCKDCGTEDSALFHDGICSNCSQKFDVDQGLSMQPKQELASMGIGKNLELALHYDPNPAQAKWDEVSGKPTESIDLEETAADIQVFKLLEARDYMNVKRRQLADQLTNLKSWLGAA